MGIQIKDLMASGEFDEALNLAKLIKESPEERVERVLMIKHKQAVAQFAKKHFEAAMQTFSEIDIEPTEVPYFHCRFIGGTVWLTHRGTVGDCAVPGLAQGRAPKTIQEACQPRWL